MCDDIVARHKAAAQELVDFLSSLPDKCATFTEVSRKLQEKGYVYDRSEALTIVFDAERAGKVRYKLHNKFLVMLLA